MARALPDNARVRWSSRLGWMIYFERGQLAMCEGPFLSEHAAVDYLIAHQQKQKIEGAFGPRRRAWGRRAA